MSDDRLIPTTEAADRLGITSDSLYAYVSRGFIRSHQRDGRKGSWFDPNDLDRLARRGRGPKPRPDVYFKSAITLIEDGHYWYRGVDPIEMASTNSFEIVAQFLWTGEFDSEPVDWVPDPACVAAARSALKTLPDTARIVEQVRLAVAAGAPHDHLRTDLRPSAVADTGRRLVASMLASLMGLDNDSAKQGSIAERVWEVIHPDPPHQDGVETLDLVLCLMADHELPASTSAARIAASYRANPYHVVAAGLGTLSGALHGGASRDVERFLAEAEAEGAQSTVGTWLGEGRGIPGLGHPLYANGDPRAVAILARLHDIAADHLAVAAAWEVTEITAARGLPAPNVDFALGVMSRSLGFRRGGAEAIMAIARPAGWIAHAIEEYENRSNIRMRALYEGPRPRAVTRTPDRSNGTPAPEPKPSQQ